MTSYDIAVIGGGIIGSAAAAYLAEAGQAVVLCERGSIAAAASGRNSGVIQHPFDAWFVELHRESLAQYRRLSDEDESFRLAERPAGLLLVSFDEAAVTETAAAVRDWAPDLQPEVLRAGEVTRIEPSVAEGVGACRLETGWPVVPAAATLAFARRARRAGAEILTQTPARPWVEGGRVRGILAAGTPISAGQVLVAAGPWTSELLPGAAGKPEIAPVWGVVVGTQLDDAPGHVLEELSIGRPGAARDRLFSLVTAGEITGVGSTFLPTEPSPEALATEIMLRGTPFVPALARAPVVSVRACARPVAFDGRPFVGAVPHVAGLYVCAGHGPWGISTGPASALQVANQMLGLAEEHPEFAPVRRARPVARNTEFA